MIYSKRSQLLVSNTAAFTDKKVWFKFAEQITECQLPFEPWISYKMNLIVVNKPPNKYETLALRISPCRWPDFHNMQFENFPKHTLVSNVLLWLHIAQWIWYDEIVKVVPWCKPAKKQYVSKLTNQRELLLCASNWQDISLLRCWSHPCQLIFLTIKKWVYMNGAYIPVWNCLMNQEIKGTQICIMSNALQS